MSESPAPAAAGHEAPPLSRRRVPQEGPHRAPRPAHGRPVASLAAAVAALAASCGADEAGDPALPAPGIWRGSLASPGGPLTFGLDLVAEDAGLRAVLVNGEERREAGYVLVRDDGRVAFEIPPYRSEIVATVAEGGEALRGTWSRDRGAGPVEELPFAAVRGASEPSLPPLSAEEIAAVSGRWSVRFAADEHDSVGEFRVGSDGRADGTFLTTLGDYRYLSGWYAQSTLLLSCFDGAHAFLFAATLQDDGTLTGDFWSRGAYHDTWTARREDGATLPDDFALTEWTGAVALSELAFEDLDGVERSLDDPSFASPARLIVLFGTWCPNCNDLTDYLVELDERYEALSILGIAFELGEDEEAHRRAVRDYLGHHGADFPVLLAGTSDKRAASAAFPLVDRVRAYPTTVFLDGAGEVSAVHTGFSGPATGEHHARLRERFESEIDRLVGAR
ncbi:MAG: TlpA disulfide reductase family protein [Planctomycetota bacterium]